MYENEWVEYDSFGSRHYLDRVVIKTDKKLPLDTIKDIVLNQFNEFRRDEDQSEYDLDQVTFDIVDLEDTEIVEADNSQEGIKND
jgi:hypothetical protein